MTCDGRDNDNEPGDQASMEALDGVWEDIRRVGSAEHIRERARRLGNVARATRHLIQAETAGACGPGDQGDQAAVAEPLSGPWPASPAHIGQCQASAGVEVDATGLDR